MTEINRIVDEVKEMIGNGNTGCDIRKYLRIELMKKRFEKKMLKEKEKIENSYVYLRRPLSKYEKRRMRIEFPWSDPCVFGEAMTQQIDREFEKLCCFVNKMTPI